MDEKLDVHDVAKYYGEAKRKLAAGTFGFSPEYPGHPGRRAVLPRNAELILTYLRDAELGKTIRTGQKKIISPIRLWRCLSVFRFLDENLGKPFDEATVQDMEALILGLRNGTILSNRGTRFGDESIMTMTKFIRKYWKYLKGNSSVYPAEVEWIDTTGRDAEIKAVPGLKDAVDRMVGYADSPMKKAAIMTLFDSGLRQSEFLCCRIKDWSASNNVITVRFPKVVGSKTEPRYVSIPYAKDLLNEWLAVHPEKNNPDALLFPMNKRQLYLTVRIAGKKAVGIDVSVHMMRHTSATFWAKLTAKTDYLSFCRRFGWSPSSSVPRRYIDYAQIPTTEDTEAAKKDQVKQLRQEIEILQAQNQSIRDQFSRHEALLNRLLNLAAEDESQVSKWQKSLSKDEAQQLIGEIPIP